MRSLDYTLLLLFKIRGWHAGIRIDCNLPLLVCANKSFRCFFVAEVGKIHQVLILSKNDFVATVANMVNNIVTDFFVVFKFFKAFRIFAESFLFSHDAILCEWWALSDSNRGPIGYEPTALTAALRARKLTCRSKL